MLKAIFQYRNLDSTQDINTRFKDLVVRGVYSGGRFGIVGNGYVIRLSAFSAINHEGMMIVDDASTSIQVVPNELRHICLDARYNPNGPAQLRVVAVTEQELAANPSYIVFGSVDLRNTSGFVDFQHLSYTRRTVVSPVGDSQFLGTYENDGDLNNEYGSAAPIKQRIGDFAFVKSSGNGIKLVVWNGIGWSEFQPTDSFDALLQNHISNNNTNAKHVTDNEKLALQGTFGIPGSANRFVTASDNVRVLSVNERQAINNALGAGSGVNAQNPLVAQGTAIAVPMLFQLNPPATSVISLSATLLGLSRFVVYIGKQATSNQVSSARQYFSIEDAYGNGYLDANNVPIYVMNVLDGSDNVVNPNNVADNGGFLDLGTNGVLKLQISGQLPENSQLYVRMNIRGSLKDITPDWSTNTRYTPALTAFRQGKQAYFGAMIAEFDSLLVGGVGANQSSWFMYRTQDVDGHYIKQDFKVGTEKYGEIVTNISPTVSEHEMKFRSIKLTNIADPTKHFLFNDAGVVIQGTDLRVMQDTKVVTLSEGTVSTTISGNSFAEYGFQHSRGSGIKWLGTILTFEGGVALSSLGTSVVVGTVTKSTPAHSSNGYLHVNKHTSTSEIETRLSGHGSTKLVLGLHDLVDFHDIATLQRVSSANFFTINGNIRLNRQIYGEVVGFAQGVYGGVSNPTYSFKQGTTTQDHADSGTSGLFYIGEQVNGLITRRGVLGISSRGNDVISFDVDDVTTIENTTLRVSKVNNVKSSYNIGILGVGKGSLALGTYGLNQGAGSFAPSLVVEELGNITVYKEVEFRQQIRVGQSAGANVVISSSGLDFNDGCYVKETSTSLEVGRVESNLVFKQTGYATLSGKIEVMDTHGIAFGQLGASGELSTIGLGAGQGAQLVIPQTKQFRFVGHNGTANVTFLSMEATQLLFHTESVVLRHNSATTGIAFKQNGDIVINQAVLDSANITGLTLHSVNDGSVQYPEVYMMLGSTIKLSTRSTHHAEYGESLRLHLGNNAQQRKLSIYGNLTVEFNLDAHGIISYNDIVIRNDVGQPDNARFYQNGNIVAKDTTLTALTVSGVATVASLSCTGSAQIDSNLTVLGTTTTNGVVIGGPNVVTLNQNGLSVGSSGFGIRNDGVIYTPTMRVTATGTAGPVLAEIDISGAALFSELVVPQKPIGTKFAASNNPLQTTSPSVILRVDDVYDNKRLRGNAHIMKLDNITNPEEQPVDVSSINKWGTEKLINVDNLFGFVDGSPLPLLREAVVAPASIFDGCKVKGRYVFLRPTNEAITQLYLRTLVGRESSTVVADLKTLLSATMPADQVGFSLEVDLVVNMVLGFDGTLLPGPTTFADSTTFVIHGIVKYIPLTSHLADPNSATSYTSDLLFGTPVEHNILNVVNKTGKTAIDQNAKFDLYIHKDGGNGPLVPLVASVDVDVAQDFDQNAWKAYRALKLLDP